MRRTANETEHQTLTRLIKAFDRHHPVTIHYTKADGTQTLRTIEIYDITLSAAGDILLKAMDRETRERRTFRLDRIQAYTIHRTAYLVPRDEDTTEATVLHFPALVAAADNSLAPVVDVTGRINALADLLAA
jgi:predicted DNA-binding transcriptional regulator YafY